MTTINTIRIAIMAGIILFISFLWKQNKELTQEKARIKENYSQIIHKDSLNFSSQLLDREEANEILNLKYSDLLKKYNLKPKQIVKIVEVENTVTDTVVKTFTIHALEPIQKRIIDSTACFYISDIISYDGKDILLKREKKKFNDNVKLILYEKRKQWKFLFIKSSLFGKKEIKPIIYSKCGQAKIDEIIIKKSK